MSDEQKLRIEFAPGVLEELEATMSQEELQEMLDDLADQFNNGTFLENSIPVDLELMSLEEPELYKELMEHMSSIDTTALPTRH